MEGSLNLPSGNTALRDNPYDDMQGPLPFSSNPHQPMIQENFPGLSLSDHNEADRAKSTSDDDDDEEELSFVEEPGKKASPRQQRVKWTDVMVLLLITAVSYINEEAGSESSTKRKCSNLQKKGKWKTISEVMAERGHSVSPQQCEDKFHGLNKRYKRLEEILGTGTSCHVVENPWLLDSMGHLSEESKEEVRKILSSKHLFYKEMCSYHNGNRRHLPPDPELQRSLRLALSNGDDHGGNGQEDEPDESEDHQVQIIAPTGSKRTKHCHAHEKGGSSPDEARKQQILRRSIELEELSLQIGTKMLEYEREVSKYLSFCRMKNKELERAKEDIEGMRLEIDRKDLELRNEQATNK